MVCRLETENHLLEIIEGYRASTVDLPLIILGNHLAGAPYLKSLINYSSANIKFIGRVFNQEKFLTLRYHFYAYLHGHSVGGTNPSLLEVMGCGNFIIAHDNQFNREVDGSSVLYFQDGTSLSVILSNLGDMADDNCRTAKQVIRERYTWKMVIFANLALLEKIK